MPRKKTGWLWGQKARAEAISAETPMPRRKKGWLWELVETLIVVGVLVLLVRRFVVEPFVVSGYSMEPNFVNGERVLVSRFAYWFSPPVPGQVIVFHPPLPINKVFIKRVIAVPGQTVSLRNGTVYINGVAQREPYIRFKGNYTSTAPYTVPPGTVYVLGDNRPNSYDSRYFKAVPDASIKGEVFFAYWPLPKLGWI